LPPSALDTCASPAADDDASVCDTPSALVPFLIMTSISGLIYTPIL